MVSIMCHSVITKNNQCCLIVHSLNDLFQDKFSVSQFSLNVLVLGAVSVSSRVDTDCVHDHELEVSLIVENSS